MGKAFRVATVGAGISGLATAYFLEKESRQRGLEMELTILERGDRLGGVIRTEKRDDLLLEWGPENFVGFKPGMLEFIHQIGLSSEVIGCNENRRRTFVVEKGSLQALPAGMAFLSPVDLRSFWSSSLISTSGKLRALLEPFIRPSRGDLSVYAFLERRLGRELTEKVGEPLVSAIYGGDIRKLSLASALPDTYHLEQKFGSLWRGTRARKRGQGPSTRPFFLTLRGGMSRLVQGLVARLGESRIEKGTGDTRIARDSYSYRVEGPHFEGAFDAVILATPAHAAAKILQTLIPEAAETLRAIPYSSITLVYLAYDRTRFSHPLDGFGFVMPHKEAKVLDACTWVSSKFEGRCPSDKVLLRCAIHDGRTARIPKSDEITAGEVHREVKRILGFSGEPVLFGVEHVPRAMPQLNVRHSRCLDRIERSLARCPGLFMAGAYSNGIGIPDCVATAHRTAAQVIRFLEGRPPDQPGS
ncbi:MAG: protoporphyrinogen oxidase [Acidobacteriota bacterium]